MKSVFLGTAIASCLFLSACSPKAQIDDLKQTASGAVSGVKQEINATVQPAINAINEVTEKMKKVQSGAQMIRRGVGQLQEAL